MTFRRAALREEVWSGEMVGVVAGGARVLLVNIDDVIYAYEDRCAHLGVALSEGRMKCGVVTCAAHEWRYDARTGKGINPARASLKALPVKVEAGAIWVDVE